MKVLGAKEQEIMDFLHERIFDPILQSPQASAELKQGVRLTIMRLQERDAAGMIQYYWSAIIGTERSIGFAAKMRAEGFGRFEEAIDEFRIHFNDEFLKQP
jgi:hypothetical protein